MKKPHKLWQLVKVEAHNFWIFKDINIDFSSLELGSLIFVQGINHDASDAKSNYSGKTTFIIDLFEWILQGTYRRLHRVGDVMGKFDNYTYGRLVYSFGKKKLIVTRYRGHPEFKNHLTVNWMGGNLSGERVVESKAMFESIVGMNAMRFIHGVLFATDSEYDIMSMLPAARNKLFAMLWGLDEFDQAASICTKVASDIDKKIMLLNERVSTMAELITQLNDTIAMLKRNTATHMVLYKDKIKELKMEIEEINDALKESGRLRKELTDKRRESGSFKDSIVELKRKLVESSKVTDEISRLKMKISMHNDKLKENDDETTHLQREIEGIMDGTRPGSICEACGNKVSTRSVMRLVEQRQASIRTSRKKRDDILKSKYKYKDRVKDLIKELGSYNVDTVTTQISKISNKLVTLDEKIAELNAVIGGVTKLEQKRERLLQDLKEIKHKVKDKENPFLKDLLKKRKEYSLLKKRRQKIILKCNQLTERFKIYKFWSGQSGFKRLRNMVLAEQIEVMSQEFASNIDAYSDGSISGKWTVSEDGSIDCLFYDALDCTNKMFPGFSSAQRSKIRFAVDLAMASLCAPTIGHVNIDEKLDVGLDDVGFRRIVEQLKINRKLAKCVFLTSHRASAIELCDAVLRIERKGGEATITLEQ